MGVVQDLLFWYCRGTRDSPYCDKKSFHYFLLDTSCQIFGISCINFFLFNNLASLPIQKVLLNINRKMKYFICFKQLFLAAYMYIFHISFNELHVFNKSVKWRIVINPYSDKMNWIYVRNNPTQQLILLSLTYLIPKSSHKNVFDNDGM